MKAYMPTILLLKLSATRASEGWRAKSTHTYVGWWTEFLYAGVVMGGMAMPFPTCWKDGAEGMDRIVGVEDCGGCRM